MKNILIRDLFGCLYIKWFGLVLQYAFCIGFAVYANAEQEQVTDLEIAKQHYAQKHYTAAVAVLRPAIKSNPSCAELYLWLGRSYGRMAQQANWVRAIGLAKKTRKNFEQAVAIAPNYRAAWQDLFEYYLKAPKMLGGGKAKAQYAAQKLASLDEHLGQQAYAEIAKKFHGR